MLTKLIPDIQDLLQRKGWFDDNVRRGLGEAVSVRLQGSFEETPKATGLRLSKMGPVCPKAFWHSIHTPEMAEPLPSSAVFKYTYGHIIEALAVTLARVSGHSVEGEQDEISVDGIVGHRDVVIDGCVVDVKSCSSLAFNKFKDGSIAKDDPFGYLEQIDGYVVGSLDDPIVQVKDRGYLWAIDKQLGRMVLYEHWVREDHIRNTIANRKRLAERDQPPSCECGTVPDGKSGNYKLDTRASYSPFKHCCFPRLRTFLYSDGPRFLSKVERLPDVPEVRH